MDQICRHYVPMLISLAGSKEINTGIIKDLWDLLERSPEKKLHLEPEKPAWTNLCRILLTGWLKRRWMVRENVLSQITFFLRGPQTFKQANGSLILEFILYDILPPPTDAQLSSDFRRYAYTTGGIQLCRGTKVPCPSSSGGSLKLNATIRETEYLLFWGRLQMQQD
jgi:hypothetical protein